MITITYKLPARNLADFCVPQTLEWTDGDPAPKEQIRAMLKHASDHEIILSVSVSDSGLYYMNSYFTGIPFYTRYADSATTWTGEWAKFIYEHLGT